MAKSPLTQLLERQAEELDALEAAQRAAVLRAFEEARLQLQEELHRLIVAGKGDSFTARQLALSQAEVEAALRLFAQQLELPLGEAVQQSRTKAIEHLVATLDLQDPDFARVQGALNVRVIARLNEDQGLLLHRYSLQTYSSAVAAEVQRQLVVGAVRRADPYRMVQAIAGKLDSTITNRMARAELILRMETNAAYSRMTLAGLQESAALLDTPGRPDPLMRRADETRDKRNHPLSLVLNDMVAPLDEPFRVSVALVAAQAERMKKSPGGVVWPREGGFYVGMTYPAHFGDRGREVPYRASWA